MDKQARDNYDKSILHEALAKYDINPETVRELDGFESYIYEYSKNNKNFILRISHSGHRSKEHIYGEMEFIDYLYENGLSVSKPLTSKNNKLIETVNLKDSYYSVCSFTKLKGMPFWEVDEHINLPYLIGKLMGRIHSLTKNYVPKNKLYKRPEWWEESIGFPEKYLPETDGSIITKYYALIKRLKKLPKSRDSYGLVHFDIHGNNYFYDNGVINLFDFDDCQYTWFIYDIAISLFYMLPHSDANDNDKQNIKKEFGSFMEGYCLENTIDSAWLSYIPSFLKLREMDLYIAINRSCDLNNLDDWCGSFMKNRKQRLENDIPFIDMDFI